MVNGRAPVHVFDSGDSVSGCSAPGPLSYLDEVTCIFSGGAFIILIVPIFILRVRYEELDGAMVQPAGVCRVQTVTAGPRADPRVTAPATDPVGHLRAAEHHPVGGTGWGLADRLLPSYNPLLQVESVLQEKERL